MDLEQRITCLTEGAKFDVSCSSSGCKRGSGKGDLGSAAMGGICHSYTPDGRCISLLKILLSNKCEYDCLYCVNRRSAETPRARITPEELCELVVGFYRRNFIEGLFLSSAVDTSPDAAMAEMARAVFLLRTAYSFRGYIHMKAIPGADPALIEYAARFADRMSVNIELPTENSLKLLAPQKKAIGITAPMKQLSGIYKSELETRGKGRGKMIPAGQTTQMIIGASGESDAQILRLTEALYDKYALKRVYYSAYMPVGSSPLLPALPPALRRENRLYQADWLLRFYGYKAEEILPAEGRLALDLDPKSDWALRNIGLFPVEINAAPYETLLRIPGIGVKNAWRIAQARRGGATLDLSALKRMRVALKRALHFITVSGKYYGGGVNPERLREIMVAGDRETLQLTMFGSAAESVEGTDYGGGAKNAGIAERGGGVLALPAKAADFSVLSGEF